MSNNYGGITIAIENTLALPLDKAIEVNSQTKTDSKNIHTFFQLDLFKITKQQKKLLSFIIDGFSMNKDAPITLFYLLKLLDTVVFFKN